MKHPIQVPLLPGVGADLGLAVHGDLQSSKPSVESTRSLGTVAGFGEKPWRFA